MRASALLGLLWVLACAESETVDFDAPARLALPEDAQSCAELNCPGDCLQDRDRARCVCPEGSVATQDGCGPCPVVEDGVLPFGYQSVRLQGSVRVDGTLLTQENLGSHAVNLQPSNRLGGVSSVDGSWDLFVAPGRYELNHFDFSTRPPFLPANRTLSRFDVLADRRLSINLQTSLLRLRIDFSDGTPSALREGSIFLQDPTTGELEGDALGEDGDFEVRMLRGRYRISFRNRAGIGADLGIIDLDQALVSARFDLGAVPVEGEVRIEGAPSAESGLEGEIVFRNPLFSGSGPERVVLSRFSEGRFQVLLFPGLQATKVRLRTGTGLLDTRNLFGPDIVVPEGGGRVDVDLALHRVRGRVRIDGRAPLPPRTPDAALSFFLRPEGRFFPIPRLDLDEEGRFDVVVRTGTYDLVYDALGPVDAPRSAPFQAVQQLFFVDGPTELDFDLASAQLTLQLPSDRGEIALFSIEAVPVPVAGRRGLSASFRGFDSEGRLSLRLLRGAYRGAIQSMAASPSSFGGAFVFDLDLQADETLDLDFPLRRLEARLRTSAEERPLPPGLEGVVRWVEGPTGESSTLGAERYPPGTYALLLRPVFRSTEPLPLDFPLGFAAEAGCVTVP